ncbi:MAG: hypothetical protein OEW95_04490 [Candidatus Bathyarchaeota archaeon]|nr:hypothetical protein [Candidatus Bathyarchaeota archaeon]
MKGIFPKRTPSLVVKVFRLFGMNVGSKEPLGSHGDVPIHTSNQPKPFNVQAYRLGNQRLNEIEGVKAMAISLSRHEKWTAGGPY